MSGPVWSHPWSQDQEWGPAAKRRPTRAEKAAERHVEQAAQEAEDRAHTEELNRRVEGLTGEPSHLKIEKGMVQGFDYESLSAVLRLVEDVLLQMR